MNPYNIKILKTTYSSPFFIKPNLQLEYKNVVETIILVNLVSFIIIINHLSIDRLRLKGYTPLNSILNSSTLGSL